MIIRNLRFGYDGGGMSCSGYVEGAKYAELAVSNNGATYFVTVMISNAFEHIEEAAVSSFPIMDVMVYSNNPGVCGEYEYKRARKICSEYYSNMDEEDSSVLPAETWESEYAGVFKIGFDALEKYDADMTNTQMVEMAEDIIKPFLDIEYL